MSDDAAHDSASPVPASPRQSYWDLPPAKTDWKAWFKRAIFAVLLASLVIRLWPIVRNFDADERAVDEFIASAAADDGLVPEAWLSVSSDASGEELVIKFVGRPERTSDGRCVTTYTARAEESERQVRVSIVSVTSLAEGSSSIAECGSAVEDRTVEVRLSTPLGSREVINEATGRSEEVG